MHFLLLKESSKIGISLRRQSRVYMLFITPSQISYNEGENSGHPLETVCLVLSFDIIVNSHSLILASVVS